MARGWQYTKLSLIYRVPFFVLRACFVLAPYIIIIIRLIFYGSPARLCTLPTINSGICLMLLFFVLFCLFLPFFFWGGGGGGAPLELCRCPFDLFYSPGDTYTILQYTTVHYSTVPDLQPHIILGMFEVR